MVMAPDSVRELEEMLRGSGVSWWTAYAVGARRDAEFAAEAREKCLHHAAGDGADADAVDR